ncbi:MAG: GNA1162 family protein [Elusimicrobiota bacterium]
MRQRIEDRGQRTEYREKWFVLFFLCSMLYALCTVFTGCTPKAKYLVENYSPPEKIAVLPFNNQSVDLDAPVIMRYLFNKRLSAVGYNTISLSEIDEKLHEMGITDGGQLPTTTPKELGEKLNVDGLIYGDVIEFKYTTLGFYYARTVQSNFKLFDSKNEKLLWEDERKVSNIKFEFREIGKAFALQLAEKTLDKALRSPLKEESNGVVNLSIMTLPRR